MWVRGGYSQIHKWVKMVQSQGAHPIVFVDGDKISEVKRQVEEKFPNVPVIHFDEGKEFENIVPRPTYFQALAEYIDNKEKVTEENFDAWWASANLPKQMMFSKRVEKWINSEFGCGFDKPKVMDRAIEIANLGGMDLTKITELIKAIRKLADKL